MWSCQCEVIESVTFGNASVHNVIERLVMRLQKDCQKVGQFNRFPGSGFPAAIQERLGLRFPSGLSQASLHGRNSEAKCR